jgi:hypothetical protein
MRQHAIASVLAIMLISLPAAAQQTPSEGKQFFDELQTRGVRVPSGFDYGTFIRDIEAQSRRTSKPINVQSFFEELSARGVWVPSPFDGRKFFDEVEAKGVAVPIMVDRQ